MKYRSYILPVAAALMMVGCSDTWNDHYDVSGTGGTESLLQIMESDAQLSDFIKVCKATHLYNNMRPTQITYAELLASDQALTVWAPENGTFNVDSLLELCQTAKGDSGVAQHFVSNHISHNIYNMNSRTRDNVRMLNDKLVELTPTSLAASQVDFGEYNIPATNGLLHKLTAEAPYYYNLYEGLTSLPQYEHMGRYLAKFEKQELDEESSIVATIENGKRVYSDSVMYKYNIMFRNFDYINEEDSSFLMLAPSKEIWETLYDEASKYYDYGSIPKADSVSGYWTNVALMQDLFFNMNRQKASADSIFSTSYYAGEWPYHVYYQPYGADGIITRANIVDSLKCSNGKIYNIGSWPFDIKNLYFHPIVVQGEDVSRQDKITDCTVNLRSVISPSVSANGYAYIQPASSTSNWAVTYQIPGTLSGTYDICVVTLPKTVALASSKDTAPNKFVASVGYVDKDGIKRTKAFDTPVVTSGVGVDTLTIGRFTFPTCNYGQPDVTASVTLNCSIKPRETKYSRHMYLDCIYLKPVTSEDEAAENAASGAQARKEGNK